MLDFLWHSIWAWIGLGGVTIVICGVVAWFIPGLRLMAIEIAGAILAATAIYAKGASDATARRKALEKRESEKAISAGNSARDAARRDAASGVSDGFQRD